MMTLNSDRPPGLPQERACDNSGKGIRRGLRHDFRKQLDQNDFGGLRIIMAALLLATGPLSTAPA